MIRLLPALTLTLLSPAAFAGGLGDPCEATADCERGLTCEVVGGTACACPAPAPDGEGFAPPPPCECPEAQDIRACVPGPCAANADCADGFVCATFEEGCAGTTEPAAPCRSDDTDCRPAPSEPPEECTPRTVSMCAPRWVLPCEAADDCGAGFTCEATEVCTCTGSGGTDTPSSEPGTPGSSGSGSDSSEPSEGGGSSDSADPAEGAPLPPEESCTCTPGDENRCRPVETPCSSDADCGEGWRCDLDSNDTPCAIPEGGVPTDPNCGAPEPASTSGLCSPIGWGGGGAFDDRGTNQETSTPTTPTDPGTTDPTTQPNTDGEAGTKASGGGCSGGFPVGPLALTLLPLVFTRRRR